MIIRIIFIVITTLLSNSLLASSNNANDIIVVELKDPTSFFIYSQPSSSVGNADPQTNSGQEYHTFEPGKEPPVTVWTVFPGPKSSVDKATLITCNTAAKFALQHLVAVGCQKGV